MPEPSARARRADLAACARALAGGSKSFAAAARVLPRAPCEAATALYAFCRHADDAVDARGADRAALERLRERLDRIYARTPADHPADRAFAEVVEHHRLPRVLPEALLEGFAWDIDARRYGDIDALTAYAARVAGTVGVMMAWLMGARDAATLSRACDLGIAMQLTNIARDVGEDARQGRLYLPADWLVQAGIDPDGWLAAPRPDPAIGAVVARLLARADVLYARAETGLAQLPPGCRPAMWAARLLYAEIGREVERRGLDPVSARAVVARRRKLWLLGRAAVRAAVVTDTDPAPTEPAARFLVDAVCLPGAPAPRRVRREKMAWLVDLFERLEREEHGRAG